ncbi:caldesmon-like [Helianthus annuus]|uniref:caldesmon-like n=1 Tax=Helianthus annuus TaxID=4232 RepID=UPI000B8FF5A6|nr:caldesmon-like [Helianthus annuus]
MSRLVPYLVTPEPKRIAHFIGGLAPEIKASVKASRPATFRSAADLSLSLTLDAVRQRSLRHSDERKRKREDENSRCSDKKHKGNSEHKKSSGFRKDDQQLGEKPKCKVCKKRHLACKGEPTKKTIDRYCHLVQEMKRLDIKKEDEEWKTAIMNNPFAQQDESLYYRGSKFETTPSSKIQTAFSADSTSGTNVAQQPYQQQSSSSKTIQIEDEKKKKAFFGIIDQDDEMFPEGFSWDKYIPDKNYLKDKAFVAQILEEESVKSKPKRKKILKSSESEEDTDDEEEYINNARLELDSFSFNLFFADKIEMLKEKRTARLKRELEELEAKRITEEKEKMEAEKVKVEEKPTQKVEIDESEGMIKVEKEQNVIEKVESRSYKWYQSQDATLDCKKIKDAACYNCNEKGHIKSNCPKFAKKPEETKKTNARVFRMVAREAVRDDNVTTGKTLNTVRLSTWHCSGTAKD